MDILQNKYNELCRTKSDINEHLPTIFKYAKMVSHITEFGVRRGVSTVAFLYSNPKELISYDISDKKFSYKLFKQLIPPSTKFIFIKASTLEVEIKETDLLFIDTFHSYDQLSCELRLHGNKSKKYIIFHDTQTYGTIGMDNKDPALQKAIYEFIESNKWWFLKEEYENNNGLIIIERKY